MTLWMLPAAIGAWAAGKRDLKHLLPYTIAALWGPLGLCLAAVAPLAARTAVGVLHRLEASAAGDAVRRSVPILLTDLGMAAEAGQPLHTALRDAADYGDGPLADALRRFGEHVDSGSSVAQALEHLRRDLSTQQTDRLIGLLSRDAQLGLPLAASVSRYRRNWLSEARRDADRTVAYLPYVFTAMAGLLLLEGVALLAVPWLVSLWRTF
ncbi:MAG: type II secretion system F family protein [Thermaerobacter sp.]|nr:type II secretion system F family protein [Thermaerobacter sp.]